MMKPEPPPSQPPPPPLVHNRRRSISAPEPPLPHYQAPLQRHEKDRERARAEREKRREEERRKEAEVRAGLVRAGVAPLATPKYRHPRRLQKIRSVPGNVGQVSGVVKQKGWITAPPPPNNAERLKKLESYDILDTPPEISYDDITKIAATLCGMPMATLSFVAETRQFFKSKIGVDVSGTPVDEAFCAHTIVDVKGFMEVKDTKQDERFYANPLVTNPDLGIRYYFGATLVTPDNQPLGALCVQDKKPRQLDEHQIAAMKSLSRLVVDQLEARAKNVKLIDLSNQLRESQRKLEELNADLIVQNSVLKNRIKELDGKQPEIELNAPVSKVVDLLSNIQSTLKNKRQKILLQEAIKIIASHKLYEVDVEEAITAGTNVDDQTKGFLLTQLDSPSVAKENIWETEITIDESDVVDESQPDENSIEITLQDKSRSNNRIDDARLHPHQRFKRKFSVVVPQSIDPKQEMAKVDAVLSGVRRLTADINEWDFDVFKFTEEFKQPLFYTTLSLLHHSDLLTKMTIPAAKLISFLSEVESGYIESNPYHNNIHASDVMLASSYIANTSGILQYMTASEHLALLIAAAVHDLGHMGVNNAFLVSTGHEVAVAHNDKSVMENFHCVQAFKILYSAKNDFLENLSLVDRQEIRKLIIELVLATDMHHHVEIFNTFQNKRGTQEGLDVANSKQDRLLVLKMIIKCADISNSAKKSDIYLNWAGRVMEEFWSQGDQEKKLGMPVSAFMDRALPDVPKCQSGFIQFIALPFYTAMVEQYPRMAQCLENMKQNLNSWKPRTPQS